MWETDCFYYALAFMVQALRLDLDFMIFDYLLGWQYHEYPLKGEWRVTTRSLCFNTYFQTFLNLFMPVGTKTVWLFCWFCSKKSNFKKTFEGEIFIYQNSVYDSKLNILWIYTLFQNYFLKYDMSRQHWSWGSPSMNGLNIVQQA